MPAQRLSPEPEPRRIVVRGVNWLGDAVMTLPALQRLRERFPSAHIALATHEKLCDLWKGYQAIDQVLPFSPKEGIGPLVQRLRNGQFDLAVLLPNSPRAALEAWLAGVPKRVGYARPWRTWLLTDAVPQRPARVPMRKRSRREIRRLIQEVRPATPAGAGMSGDAHQVHDYLGLMAALGASSSPLKPILGISTEDADAVASRWSAVAEPAPHLWIGVNASAAYGPAKRWPLDHFAQAIQQIVREVPLARVLAFGAKGAKHLNDELARRSGVALLDLAGQTSLRELMGLLKRCAVLITNDSGPMHLAAALGTPVVVPFGSTSPELTGPGMPGEPLPGVLKARAPCAPCFRRACPIDLRCMNSITVQEVVTAARRVLEARIERTGTNHKP